MVFPDPDPCPPQPHAFSPVQVAPEEGNSMAQLAQVAGHVQPELLDGISFDFESLDTLFVWEQGGTLPEPTLESRLGGGIVSIFIPTMKELTNICIGS
jgi:hypothetical protein